MAKSIGVLVPAILAPYVEQTLARLSYLHGEANFTYEGNRILVEFSGDSGVSVREVTYQLYREKIYQESLPMRKLMYRTLLS